jgi:F-type H+-transporting ATPase subunit delta
MRREAKRVFRLCFVDGLLNEDRVREAVQRVAEGKHRGYLLFLSCFERLVRLESDRHTAQIDSARSLPQDLQDTISSRLRKTYGPSINIQFSEDAKLIGGIRVKVGSDVYDGSVQHGLRLVAKRF